MSSQIAGYIEKNQMVHIASEIVVLLGMSFYFSAKNKKLLGYIEELSQRLEDQEDQVHKLDQTVSQLSSMMNSVNLQLQRMSLPKVVPPTLQPKTPSVTLSKPKKKEKETTPLPSSPPYAKKKPKVEEIHQEQEEETDLDEELADELRELNQSGDEEEENSLKKQA